MMVYNNNDLNNYRKFSLFIKLFYLYIRADYPLVNYTGSAGNRFEKKTSIFTILLKSGRSD